MRSLAFCDSSGSWDAASISASYVSTKTSFTINGEYRYVIDGHSCDWLIFAAREEGSVGEHGIRLFYCSPEHPAIERKLLPTLDQTRKQAAITVDQLVLDASYCLTPESTSAWPILERALQLASIGLAAEQAGGAQQMLTMSLDYLHQREQFGRTLASFQALKHKAADMQLKIEVSRSAIYYAACMADLYFSQESNEPVAINDELKEAASMAKAYCSEAFYFCAGNAIQLFGGVGFTWEYDVHLYFKRAKASQLFLGDAAYHREIIAQQLLDNGDKNGNQLAAGAQ